MRPAETHNYKAVDAVMKYCRGPVREAEERVIRAALGFDAVMAEFEGDMSACGEHLDGLFTACDALRKARDAAFADGEKS